MMEKSLRFCMITTFYPPYNFGGDGIFVHRLSNELARREHRVDVVHCIDSYSILARRRPTGNYNDHPSITVHGLKSPLGYLSPLATQQTGQPLFKAGRLRRILDKGFDVIMFHNISLVGGPGILKYGVGIKIYAMHEYWLICPAHVLLKYNRRACMQSNCLVCTVVCHRPPQWWRKTGILKAAAEHVDAFISPSLFSIEKHREMGLDLPFVHIPYFVPPGAAPVSDFKDPAPAGDRKPYFLFVGRLEKLKGLQTLITVFRRHPKAELLVAGRGSYESSLRKMAQGAPGIRFLGHLPEERLRALYRGATALIVPSLCYELYPLVLLEACREGTPVIARKTGGMPEIVEKSGGGFVYQREGELLAAIDHLLEEPDSRREMGARGKLHYDRNWTTEAHLDRLLGLIGQMGERR
jgi:glycosyltransferase involved in cell wall biosynthesis